MVDNQGVKSEQIIDALSWRYAVKKFDTEQKLKAADIALIERALFYTPTSMGLQLMHFIVVTNSEVKKRMLAVAYNQNQVVDASHVIVLCRKKEIVEKDIDNFITQVVERRNLEVNKLVSYESMLKSVLKLSKEQQVAWMNNQVYLALGNLLTTCAIARIDACPMEGFDNNLMDELLDLGNKNLASVVIVPVGYRSESDNYSTLKKVRRKRIELISNI